MKTTAALIAGLLLSVATFLGGLMTGSIAVGGSAPHLKPQNMDTASLWTNEPMQVNREQQVLTRLPARQRANTATANKAAVGGSVTNSPKGKTDITTAASQNAVDPMTTSAINPGQPVDAVQKADPGQQAHAEWCSRRYASYRVADNTYQPYSGARRPCVSPNQNVTTADNASERENISGGNVSARQQPSDVTANDNQAEVQKAAYDETAAETGGVGDGAHRESCLRRYRSYNAEDNSYQPLDGGPRRQCE